MHEVAIWSYDDDLLEFVNELKIEGVEYGRVVFDDVSSADNITAYINLGASLINFLTIALSVLASKKKKEDKKMEIYIRTKKTNIDLENLVDEYKDKLKIEIIEIPDKQDKS